MQSSHFIPPISIPPIIQSTDLQDVQNIICGSTKSSSQDVKSKIIAKDNTHMKEEYNERISNENLLINEQGSRHHQEPAIFLCSLNHLKNNRISNNNNNNESCLGKTQEPTQEKSKSKTESSLMNFGSHSPIFAHA